MYPYLVTYIISTIFAYIASIIDSKPVKFIFCVLSIAPVVLLAALRDMTIGGDTSDYPWFLYNVSYYMQYIEMLSQYSDSYDFLFVLGTAYVTKTFRNFNVVLGSYQLFMSAIFICYMYKEHPRSIWIGMMTYNAFVFQTSLTIIRQLLAYSVLLVSFFLAKHKKPILFLVTIGIAFCFHRTGILGIIIYPLFMLFRMKTFSKEDKKFKLYLTFIIILGAGCVFLVTFILKDELIRFLALTKESYKYQVSRLNRGKLTNSSIFMLAFNIGTFYIFANKNFSNVKGKNYLNPSLFVAFSLTIVYFFLSLFSLAADSLQRIAMGFLIFYPIFYTLLADNAKTDKHRAVFIFLLIAFTIFYTIFMLTNATSYQCVPYKSQVIDELLGIHL